MKIAKILLFVVTALVLLSGCAAGFANLPPPGADHGLPSTQTGERLVDRLERADQALKEARLTDAEVMYRDLTAEHPRLPDVWLRLGNIYVRQSQLQAAERTYTRGLKFRPKDARLWNNLALVQTKRAVQTLEASSQVLDPDDPYLLRIRRFHKSLMNAGGAGEATTLEQDMNSNGPTAAADMNDASARNYSGSR